MRDGIRLATALCLGDDITARPAVLVRLPYDKSGRYTFMPQLAAHFTSRGYVFVVQDIRGKFRSGGDTMPYAHEVTDGYETIDWISQQRWCDGTVGMFGDSYYGYTQWAAVASGHPRASRHRAQGYQRRHRREPDPVGGSGRVVVRGRLSRALLG